MPTTKTMNDEIFLPENAAIHIMNNRSFNCFLIKKIKSKLGNHPKTRSDLEYESLPSPGLILISNSTNNANEIKGGAYVPLAAE